MRNLFLMMLLPVVLLCGCSGNKEETPRERGQVTLYDRNKEAIAYIDWDDESTIYLFDGTPVAYIVSEKYVYRFYGNLMGWYVDGVLYDKTYHAVGARHGILRFGIETNVTQADKEKYAKREKPVKYARYDAYEHQVLHDTWSETSLTDFFMRHE